VLAAAGPFALCGEPLVAACAAAGAHYLDVTGETPWVAEMAARHGAAARAARAIFVPLAGFDSVPSDAGALACVAAARARGARLARVTAVAAVRGALSGGTVATAAALAADARARAAAADPLLLVPAAARARAAPLPDGEWPSREPALGAGVWTQPHLMAAINTRVVRQSAALFALHGAALRAAAARAPALAAALPPPAAGGGPDGADAYAYALGAFGYRERALARSRAGALAATALGALAGAALAPACAPLVRRLLPAPGEGPSDAAAARGSFRLFFVGEREGGGAPVVTSVEGPDPYVATAQSLAEAGLLIAAAARDGALDELPAAAFGFGFLTPAAALGLRLVERLKETGWVFTTYANEEEAAAAAAPRARRDARA